MPLQTANWDSNKDLPVGKGATIQQFFTTLGKDRFEINVAPWGEGQLKVNGLEIARTAEAKDRHQAFARLKHAAERYARERGPAEQRVDLDQPSLWLATPAWHATKRWDLRAWTLSGEVRRQCLASPCLTLSAT